ncbi:hypothetical protein [Fibrobacter sp. UWR2]|uniref:hypothetical protein n=1 Tax=Fibrobacter sp. UWR2 TaxID=1964352 RepID=UPI000B5221F4|nr:hypothetical protein [Fibrobacter sp. UWR2]OWV00333.1 hypothetical protein B7994_07480 [Fibrobacter sp. UWR2]
MNKINFKTGTIIPPELMNALQNPSFTNDEEEAGHLPLPPNYGKKVQVFNTENRAVDLSTASSGFAVVIHHSSSLSGEPETVTIDGVGGTGANTILLVTRGTDYPVIVSLPQNSVSRKEISIKGGSSVLLTFFSYGAAYVWKYYELETNPVAMTDTGWKSFTPGGVSTDFVKFATLKVPKDYSAIVMVKGTGHSEYPVTSGSTGIVKEYTFKAIDANNNEENCEMSILKVNEYGRQTQDYDARDDRFSGYLVIPPLSTPAQRSVDLKLKTNQEAITIAASFRALLYKANLDTTLLA